MLQANLLCRMTGLAAQIAVTKNSFVVVKQQTSQCAGPR